MRKPYPEQQFVVREQDGGEEYFGCYDDTSDFDNEADHPDGTEVAVYVFSHLATLERTKILLKRKPGGRIPKVKK